MTKPIPGSRWKSAVCDTEAVVVRPPSDSALPECGGAAMVPIGDARPKNNEPRAGYDHGSLLGKRYADELSGLEMLCTKPGRGALGIGGRLLIAKDAKKLPSSD